MYYAEYNNNIVAYHNTVDELNQVLAMLPQYKGAEIKEVPDGYIISSNYKLITVEEFRREQAQKEQERIMKLHMTPLDFLKALNKIGITYETVKQIMEANPEVEMEMKFCQNVYRGHPMIIQFAQQFNVPDETLDYIFKKANGEEE